ncbi:hypothetical protein NDU88_000937 [Pleurodeles waltl]|uniref:Uncharacterized protein n=1 Tax=Pleurodeles waltl TaxID=8319 RepID=A0AAV7U924_PLEWA|nr:hypothetical protein NDU88_000937 [Pleurodeles waltl]
MCYKSQHASHHTVREPSRAAVYSGTRPPLGCQGDASQPPTKRVGNAVVQHSWGALTKTVLVCDIAIQSKDVWHSAEHWSEAVGENHGLTHLLFFSARPAQQRLRGPTATTPPSPFHGRQAGLQPLGTGMHYRPSRVSAIMAAGRAAPPRDHQTVDRGEPTTLSRYRSGRGGAMGDQLRQPHVARHQPVAPSLRLTQGLGHLRASEARWPNGCRPQL